MPFTTRRRRQHHAPVAPVAPRAPRAPRRGNIFSRFRRAPVQQQRKPTLRDKVGGALTRLGGRLTGRSGVKAAGARRIHGTDGRGSHRRGRRFF